MRGEKKKRGEGRDPIQRGNQLCRVGGVRPWEPVAQDQRQGSEKRDTVSGSPGPAIKAGFPT